MRASLALALVLAGCSTLELELGDPIDSERCAAFEVGRARRAEVLAALAWTSHQHLLRPRQAAPGGVVASPAVLADQTGQLRPQSAQRLARHDLTQPRDDPGEKSRLGPPTGIAGHGEGVALLYEHVLLDERQLGLSLEQLGLF